MGLLDADILMREYALEGIESRISELRQDANGIRAELDELKRQQARQTAGVRLSKNGKRLGRPPKGEQKAMKKIA